MPTITTVDATWTTGVSMDDAELRRADSAMFLGDGTANGVRGGIVYHGPSSLAVTVNGSDQVTVQAGAFVIPAATGLGAYRGSLAATTSAVGITARNATNPRIDLVVIQAPGIVKTIDGTPAASPSAPALPAQHIELARVTVPAVGGGAVTVDSTWRTFASSLGGVLPVATAARLPGSGNLTGQRAIALDTGKYHAWSGTEWGADSAPRGVLGYAQVTANQSGITVETALAGLTAAVTVGASRRLRITAVIRANPTAAADVDLRIKEGATILQIANVTSAAGSLWTMTATAVVTPTAGAHTYALTMSASASTNMFASSLAPSFVLVEDIGAA